MFSHWNQLQRGLYRSVWEPCFVGVINELDLVQKALGRLVRALNPHVSVEGKLTRGQFWGKETGLPHVCVCVCVSDFKGKLDP